MPIYDVSLQANTVGHQQVIVSNPNLILGGHNNVQIQAQSPFMTDAAAATTGASLQRQARFNFYFCA